MDSEHYARVISEWCAATGMAAWRPDEDSHIEIDDTLVGLIPGGSAGPDTLHICIDLGRYDAPDLWPGLLEANVPLEGEPGCFGLHPLTQAVVYRTWRQLDARTDGARLPQEIASLIDAARRKFDAAIAP